MLRFRLVACWEGWRRPLRALEIWNDRHELVAVLEADLVTALLSHYLEDTMLTMEVREAMRRTCIPPLPDPPVKPLRGRNGRRLRGRRDGGS